MSEEDQTLVFSLIGLLSCASAQTLPDSVGSNAEQLLSLGCSICDTKIGRIKSANLSEDIDLLKLFATLERLLKLTPKPKGKFPRVAAMISLRRLLCHTASLGHFNLSKSTLGQWCLQAMRSSSRDLRVAAG